jgi:hypothetical protein
MANISNHAVLNRILLQFGGVAGAGGIAWTEGTTITLATGNVDTNVDLAKGTTDQVVQEIMITAPGAVGDLTIALYDGTVAAGTLITGTMQFRAFPNGTIKVGKALSTGTLGIRIAGFASGTTKAYVNVIYGY